MKKLILSFFLLLLPAFIYSQTSQLPYPIIFVHGINSSANTWFEDGLNNDVFDYLQNAGLTYGGNLNVCLDYLRSNTTLANSKEEDVHLFPPTIIDGDLYTVNFNVHSSGSLGWEHNYGVITSVFVSTSATQFNVNSPVIFQIDDIIRVNDEFMRVLGIGEDFITVERAILGSNPETHLFNNTVWNLSLQSNQASIAKQGWGLKEAIDFVKTETNAEKVILVGHSMGGLAAREYIRSYYYQNDVAKLITIGTPHLGSTITDFFEPANNFVGVDERSDAMRDLRYTYGNDNGDPQPPFGNIPDDAVFLFGGPENYSNFPFGFYYSADFNADGDENDFINGLSFDLSTLPTSIDYTWITSQVNSLPISGDGCVRLLRQFPWFELDQNSQPIIEIGDTLLTHYYHWVEPTSEQILLRGLDEPDLLALAYDLFPTNMSFSTYSRIIRGLITYQTNYAVQDTDYYKFTISTGGSLVLSCTNISFSNGVMTLLDDSLTQIATTNLPNSINQTLIAGTYYIRITGDATSTSWQNPYTLSINVNNPDPFEPNNSFAEATLIDVGMSTQLHTIYPTGDVDYIKFNVIQGYGYTIRTENETGVDATFYVYNSSQVRLSSQYGTTEQFNYLSTETGVNYVKVQRGVGDQTGNYTIRVLPGYWNGDAQIVYDNYYEPNPSSFNAYLLQPNGVNHFNLTQTGDQDWFRITASQGNMYTATLAEENGASVTMYVYFENADHSLTRLSSQYGTDQFQWTSSQTGSYIILVERAGGLSEGDYKIRVNSQTQSYEVKVYPGVLFMRLGDAAYKLYAGSSNSTGITWSSMNEAIATVDQNGNVTPVSVGNVKIRATSNDPPNHYDEVTVYVAPVGDYEPNSNFIESTPIAVGMEIQSHLIYPSGDIDYLKFNVVQGFGYTVMVDEEIYNNVIFYVYNSSQVRLSSQYGTEEQFSYVSAETGVNYIRVEGGKGNYTIRVLPGYWNGDAQIVYDNYYEPNPSSFNAYLLQPNGVNHFNLTQTGDQDWFRITASQGNMYTATLAEENGASVTMYVYFENADHSLTRLSSQYGTDQFQWTSSQTGSYIILVERAGGLSEGDYKIRVNSQTQSYEVKVYPGVLFMRLGDAAYKLYAGSSNSTGITWSSMNEAIATVDQNGNVTPVSVGNVKIRATSNDPPNHYDEVTVYVAPVGDYEPNSNFIESTPIAVGMEIQSHLIYPSGDIDYLKFNVVQGFGYTVMVDEEIYNNVIFYVYNSSQVRLSSQYGTEEQFSYVSAETGVNYIRVEGGKGNYTIRVLPGYWNGDAQIVYDNYYEPNPSSFNAYLLQPNGVNHFNLTQTGDQDWFRITASQGNMYTATLAEENGASVTMYVYFENADHSLTRLSSQYGTDQFQWTSSQTGSYIILVERAGGLSEGDYKIRVNSQTQSYEVKVYPGVLFMRLGDAAYKLYAGSSNSTGITWSSMNEAIATVDQNGNVTPVSVGNVKIRATSNDPPNHYDEVTVYVAPVGDYEPNSNFIESTPIAVGMEIQSHLIYPSGDIDYLKFNVVQGFGYTVMVDEEIYNNVIFYVYNSSQVRLSSQYGTEEQFSYVSAETGVNYIRVEGGKGNYTIRVLPGYWNGDAQIVYDNYYEPNPSSFNAYLLQPNGVNHFNLTQTGDQDWFRIYGNQGDKDTVTLSEENAVDVTMYVYFENADHSLTRLSSQYGTTTQFSWTCTQTGIYMILVQPAGGLNEGDYKIRVGSLPSIQTFQFAVSVQNGWNMVSTPGLHPTNQNVTTWWSGKDPAAGVFRFSGGYLPVTTTTSGQGYWMKHIGPFTYNYTGIQVVANTSIAGATGWNLIGGFELSVLTANITTTPGGLQTGQVFGYSSGYTPATNLVPGYGYWIKLTGAGSINIPTSLAKGLAKTTEVNTSDWGKIIITDKSGKSYTLYTVKGDVNLNDYELPPAPPEGMFDVRFGSGRYAEELSAVNQTIELNSLEYPVRVRVENADIRLQDGTGNGMNERLKSGEEVIISNSSINKLMVSGDVIPATYSLDQNYPNPFNPSTKIEFSIPEDVNNVTLTIYNALGQRVAELVNSKMEAGKYSYVWNASDVATGLYIYELRTDKFVSVKKMILLK